MKDYKEFEIGDIVQVVTESYCYEGVVKDDCGGYILVESIPYGIQRLDSSSLRHSFPVEDLKKIFIPTDKMKYLLDEIYKYDFIYEHEYELAKKNGHICSMFISIYVEDMYRKRKRLTSKRSCSSPSRTYFGHGTIPSTPSYKIEDDEDSRYTGFSIAGDDDDDDDCCPGVFGDMYSKKPSGGFSYGGFGDDDDDDCCAPGFGG